MYPTLKVYNMKYDHTTQFHLTYITKTLFQCSRVIPTKIRNQKAKVMNFSISYGKSAFAKDWNCSEEEAKKIIDLWYSDRPEIKQWQKNQKDFALKYLKTTTLIGR